MTSAAMDNYTHAMRKNYSAKTQTIDAKPTKERRFRNILANSGEVMESGEVRDLEHMYVMGRDRKLIPISSLNQDPEKQTEEYSLKLQADHGEFDAATGEPVPSVEKVFGECRVWQEEDGLHARAYFGENALADHCWGISENASYSIGADWYPEGYYGADNEIDGPVGILREISMVVTGNDPSAMTIDSIPDESKGSAGAAKTAAETLNKKGNHMNGTKKSIDALTPDERAAMMKRINEAVDEVIDDFTTDVPESETEPTARESKDEVDTSNESTDENEATDAKKMADSTILHKPFKIIKDRAPRQERAMSTADAYLKSDRAVEAWARALLDSKGNARAWKDNFRRIAKRDGVDFGNNVSLAPELVVNAIAEQLHDEDRLFSHANKTGLAYEIVAIPTSEGEASGHVRGKKKNEESITGTTRVLTPADIYKLMKLDHSMVKLNGGISSSAIVKYVLSELPRKLLDGIDRSMLVGGIKNDDAEGETAATDFNALIPIMTDIGTANSIYASVYTAEAGDNIRATISKAAGKVLSSSDRTLITTPDFFTDLENSTVRSTSGLLLFPNGINKGQPNINGIRRIITPLWLTADMLGDYEAVVVDLSAYHIVGDTNPENFTDYDIDYNKYVWEVVSCVGGGLANKNAAVGIKAATAASSAD